MAVTNTSTYAALVGNGVATAFPFAFAAASAAEVAVSVNGAPVSGFSVALAAQGGTVTFPSPPPSGASVLIQSAPSFQQTATFANEGGFQPAVFDAVHDRLAIADLYLRDQIARSIRVPAGEAGLVLPPQSSRAGRLLALGSDVSGVLGFLDATLLRSTVPGPPGAGSTVGVTPEQFGAKGDGVTNDTDAFVRMSAYIQARGGGKIELASTTYLVGKQIPLTSSQPGDIFAVHNTLAPSRIIWLNGLPFGVSIYGNGAKFKIAPGLKFGTFNTQTGQPAPDFSSAPTSERFVAYNAIIGVQNAQGPVYIRDVHMDGSCEDAVWGGRSGDYDWQLPGSGFWLQDNAEVHVDNCFGYRCLLDGIQYTAVAPVLITNSRFQQNVRLGGNLREGAMSTCINSWFDESGTTGHSTNPAAGFDLECEDQNNPVDRAVFIHCRFAGNFYSGLVAASGVIRGATFDNCLFWSRAAYGAAINLFVAQFSFRDCVIGGSLQFGIQDSDGHYGLPDFYHCLFTDNVSYAPAGYTDVGVGGNTINTNNTGTVFRRCAFDYAHTPFYSGPEGIGYEDCYIKGVNQYQVIAGTYSKNCTIMLPGVDLNNSSNLVVLDGTCTLNGTALKQNVGLMPAAFQPDAPALTAGSPAHAAAATPTQAEFNALADIVAALKSDLGGTRSTLNGTNAALRAANIEHTS